MTSSRPFYRQSVPAPGNWRGATEDLLRANAVQQISAAHGHTNFEPDLELQSVRAVFGEKVKELSVALAKVDALTRQLEELKKGNTTNSYQFSTTAVGNAKYNQELDKLRQELLYRSKVADEQHTDLAYKKSLITQKKSELSQLDEKILELQERLVRKRQRAAETGQERNKRPAPAPSVKLASKEQPVDRALNGRSVGSPTRLFDERTTHTTHHLLQQRRQEHPLHSRLQQPEPSATRMSQAQHSPQSPSQTLHVVQTHQAPPQSQPQQTAAAERETQGYPAPGAPPPALPGALVSAVSSFPGYRRGPDAVDSDGTSPRYADSLAPVSFAATTAPATTAVPTGSIDWQKVKRRPVVVEGNDMEREFTAQMTRAFEAQSLSDQESSSLSPSESSPPRIHVPPAEASRISPPVILELADVSANNEIIDVSPRGFASEDAQEKSVESVEGSPPRASEQPSNDTINTQEDNRKTSPISLSSTTAPLNTSPVKRLRGSMKSHNQEPKNEHRGITRRVSFDPLALLLDAALEGELELVKKSASQVPNPSAVKDEGITALHNAICAGHFPIVQYLVQIGCDVNAQDSDGWTPLHCAASCNNLTMVKFLVEHGACIFATTLSDHETAAEKCEEDEEGFDGCSQYLYSVQENLGVLNGGVVFAVYDYEAQNSDELSFAEGDRIAIVTKSDEQEREWWWAKFKNAEGYVPRNLFGLFPRVKPLSSSSSKEPAGDGLQVDSTS